ncbi:MAG TPA: metallophosphoesterase, partial [Buchnera sp. (in: enterobacteria)]|nr:metallophosphoesterase [Buchnera sp. (in: enterobacteria)]
MSTYFVGDIHGCYDQLKLLLNRVSFNPVKDILWCTG